MLCTQVDLGPRVHPWWYKVDHARDRVRPPAPGPGGGLQQQPWNLKYYSETHKICCQVQINQIFVGFSGQRTIILN